MEKGKESADRMTLRDYKRYLGCCTFAFIGLSLFHMGFEWVGFGVIVASWAAWATFIAVSFLGYALGLKGGD